MSDELQGVELDMSPELAESEQEVQPQESPESAKPEEGSALAPDTGEGQEKETEPDGQLEGTAETEQDRVQQAINKQHRKFRDEERAHGDTKRELDEAKQELARLKGQDTEPTIPPAPDIYAEDYQEQMARRDAALQAHAAWRGRQEAYAEKEAEEQKQAYIAEQNELANMADGYTKRAAELKINGESLQKASQVVTQYGMPDDIVRLLLADEIGPLMTQYLASDIQMLDSLVRKSPIEVGQFIERELRPKAEALRPKTSDTPPPPDSLAGAGPGNDVLGPHKGVVID